MTLSTSTVYNTVTGLPSSSTIVSNQNLYVSAGGTSCAVSARPFSSPMLATVEHIENITKRLDVIENRLAILSPNTELEERWEQLKLLGEQYRQLEQDILEKEKLMKILSE